MNTILIGDVHGCIDEFRELVQLCGYRRDLDRLILLGDLVDRGPDGVAVVQYANDLKAELVMGNHDDKVVRYRKHARRAQGMPSYKNPMWTRARQDFDQSIGGLLGYLKQGMPSIRFGENWVAVHAGVLPGSPAEEQDPKLLMILRYLSEHGHKPVPLTPDLGQPEKTKYWTEMHEGPDIVVYGHNVYTEPVRTPFSLGLDTGCVFGGQLTAAVFDGPVLKTSEPRFVHVKAAREYADYSKRANY